MYLRKPNVHTVYIHVYIYTYVQTYIHAHTQSYLKDVLSEMCDFHKSGEHIHTFTLKPSYQRAGDDDSDDAADE